MALLNTFIHSVRSGSKYSWLGTIGLLANKKNTVGFADTRETGKKDTIRLFLSTIFAVTDYSD